MTDADTKHRALLIACIAIYGPFAGPWAAQWLWVMFPKSVSGTYGKALSGNG